MICWVDCLIDQTFDDPSITYFDRLKIKQWVAGLDLGHSKLFIFYFCKFIKKNLQRILQEIVKKHNTLNIRCLVDQSFVPATNHIILKIDGFKKGDLKQRRTRSKNADIVVCRTVKMRTFLRVHQTCKETYREML